MSSACHGPLAELEELPRAEAEEGRHDVRGEGADAGVVGPHVAVVEATAGRDPVLGVRELLLEREEALARLEVRVGLDPREQLLQRAADGLLVALPGGG
jgi:hypothetical protein